MEPPADTTAPSPAPTPAESSKWQVSETVAIAAASVLGYWFAYAYELGYCHRFLIPREFISLELSSVFGVVGVVWLTVLLIGVVTYHLSVEAREHRSPYAYRLKLLVMPACMTLLGLAMWSLGVAGWWLTFAAGAAMLAAICVGTVAVPLWRHRAVPTVRGRLAEADAHEPSGPRVVIRAGWRSAAARPLLAAFVAAVMFWALCYASGRSEAGAQRWFLVRSSDPQSVVLRVYGDEAVCAEFDREAGTVQPRFTLLNLGEGAGPLLSLEVVGPLRYGPRSAPDPSESAGEK